MGMKYVIAWNQKRVSLIFQASVTRDLQDNSTHPEIRNPPFQAMEFNNIFLGLLLVTEESLLSLCSIKLVSLFSERPAQHDFEHLFSVFPPRDGENYSMDWYTLHQRLN